LGPGSGREQQQTHHYNWIVCKNGGMSEEEDGCSEGEEQEIKKEKENFKEK
jgi:hypothetical protein